MQQHMDVFKPQYFSSYHLFVKTIIINSCPSQIMQGTSKTPKESKYEICFALFVSLVFFREGALGFYFPSRT